MALRSVRTLALPAKGMLEFTGGQDVREKILGGSTNVVGLGSSAMGLAVGSVVPKAVGLGAGSSSLFGGVENRTDLLRVASDRRTLVPIHLLGSAQRAFSPVPAIGIFADAISSLTHFLSEASRVPKDALMATSASEDADSQTPTIPDFPQHATVTPMQISLDLRPVAQDILDMVQAYCEIGSAVGRHDLSIALRLEGGVLRAMISKNDHDTVIGNIIISLTDGRIQSFQLRIRDEDTRAFVREPLNRILRSMAGTNLRLSVDDYVVLGGRTNPGIIEQAQPMQADVSTEVAVETGWAGLMGLQSGIPGQRIGDQIVVDRRGEKKVLPLFEPVPVEPRIRSLFTASSSAVREIYFRRLNARAQSLGNPPSPQKFLLAGSGLAPEQISLQLFDDGHIGAMNSAQAGAPFFAVVNSAGEFLWVSWDPLLRFSLNHVQMDAILAYWSHGVEARRTHLNNVDRFLVDERSLHNRIAQTSTNGRHFGRLLRDLAKLLGDDISERREISREIHIYEEQNGLLVASETRRAGGLATIEYSLGFRNGVYFDALNITPHAIPYPAFVRDLEELFVREDDTLGFTEPYRFYGYFYSLLGAYSQITEGGRRSSAVALRLSSVLSHLGPESVRSHVMELPVVRLSDPDLPAIEPAGELRQSPPEALVEMPTLGELRFHLDESPQALLVRGATQPLGAGPIAAAMIGSGAGVVGPSGAWRNFWVGVSELIGGRNEIERPVSADQCFWAPLRHDSQFGWIRKGYRRLTEFRDQGRYVLYFGSRQITVDIGRGRSDDISESGYEPVGINQNAFLERESLAGLAETALLGLSGKQIKIEYDPSGKVYTITNTGAVNDVVVEGRVINPGEFTIISEGFSFIEIAVGHFSFLFGGHK